MFEKLVCISVDRCLHGVSVCEGGGGGGGGSGI